VGEWLIHFLDKNIIYKRNRNSKNQSFDVNFLQIFQLPICPGRGAIRLVSKILLLRHSGTMANIMELLAGIKKHQQLFEYQHLQRHLVVKVHIFSYMFIFSTPVLNYTSVAAQDSCFAVLVTNTCCSISLFKP
jgi:hypothetical protein